MDTYSAIPKTFTEGTRTATNYFSIIEQTHEEKVKMYMEECTKEELAEMLANCNEILDAIPPMMYYYDETGKWKMIQDGNGILRTRENIDIK